MGCDRSEQAVFTPLPTLDEIVAKACSRTRATWGEKGRPGCASQLSNRITASTSPAMQSMRHVSRVSALAIRASSSASPALN